MNILKWESIEIGLLLEPVPRNCSFWLFCSGLIIQPPEQLILTLLSSYTFQTAACMPKEYAWMPDMFDMYQNQIRLCAC